ncbi:MAG: sulfatase [Mariniblastus sp.]|nr:sulfatase [Mariniblastus sp.]
MKIPLFLCSGFLILLSAAPGFAGDPVVVGPAKPNVLFIAIDDMNDWVGFLGGHPQAKTPNMDKLAKRGVCFTNAHCIAPACSPCRLGLMYGVEPFHSGFYPFYNHSKIPQEVLGKYTSLSRHFRNNGYNAFGAGKIFHGSKSMNGDWDDYHSKNNAKLEYAPQAGYQQGKSQKMAFCPTTNKFEDHPDHQFASYGIDILKKQHDKPFFLAVGLVKPHLAFVCPQQFFDMHAGPIQKPKIRHRDLEDVPWVGRSMAKLSDDLRYRTDESWEQVRRAYLACISWADYNIGRVLDELEDSPHADNTIVVLWSDHGYHQGEKRSFRKFSLWEESTRVPFIIYDPRPGKMKAGNCTEAVSLINIYKTLGEMAGIESPAYVDGESLVPQLREPSTPIELPAITTWGRGNYTVRDDKWRYTRYFDGGEELYNHSSDPQEWNNLAADLTHQARIKEMATFLPKNEAPQVVTGRSLWNVIDADQPKKLKTFKNQTWPQMKEKLRPAIEKQ